MENKINIAELLRDMPKGTKLYSPLFGDVELDAIKTEESGSVYPIMVAAFEHGRIGYGKFTEGGFYYDSYQNSEPTLFPSRNMRDWTKFAWKKGDVLVNQDKTAHIVFEKFDDDTYATFTGRHYYYNNGEDKDAARVCCNIITDCFTLETKDAAQIYINAIEEKLGGKLNRETLEIEKQSKCPFKPFDKVLVRDTDDQEWKINFFSHYDEKYSYSCLWYYFKQCIPYEGNKHLLGTTDNPK